LAIDDGWKPSALSPINALERTVNHRGALFLCESASWPAAQLGRYAAKAEHRGHGVVAALRPLR
jgi:hypothetical protein